MVLLSGMQKRVRYLFLRRGKRFYCEKCKSFYSDYRAHPCNDPCRTCLHKVCLLISSEKRTCSECFKFCRSIKCFDHHKKSCRCKGVDLLSKCDTSLRCQSCLAVVDRKRQDEHICGEHVCHICKEYVLSDHLCYMQPELPKTPCDKFIFYDFETDFSTGEHVVNFAIAQYAGGTEFVFKGYDALNEFCRFYFQWNIRDFQLLPTTEKVLTRF